MMIKSCPNCKSAELTYSWSFANLFTESLAAFKEFDIKKIILLPIVKEVFLAIPYTFIKDVTQNIPSNPGLLCKHCRHYLLSCPLCETLFETKEFPSGLATYSCPKCKSSIVVCERNKKFDLLLSKGKYKKK